MLRVLRRTVIVAVIGVCAFLAAHWLGGHNFSVLNPSGPVALRERNLMEIAMWLSIIVILPVFALTFGIAWKYRESNQKAAYRPEWDHNRVAETIWWVIPSVIILILSVVTWRSSHELDPRVALASNVAPLRIQVIALDWKWLFIYPDQKIATLNYVALPVNTPVEFELTSDAPMNSFWIPQLGGQVYAMSGMMTQLHLLASHTGNYTGQSANISGRGFAGMKFMASAQSPADFASFVATTQATHLRLDAPAYDVLVRPSESDFPTSYVLSDTGLFDEVISKYMPGKNSHDMVNQ